MTKTNNYWWNERNKEKRKTRKNRIMRMKRISRYFIRNWRLVARERKG
jgi:hypothetical protein